MANIIRSVHNPLSYTVSIFVPGGDGSHAPVTIASNTTLDLLTVVTADELEAMQGNLQSYVSSGALTVIATISDSSLDEGSPSALIVQSATSSPAVSASPVAYNQSHIASIVALVNELKAKMDAMNGH